MSELTLTGLDGSNPLGFMAALGLLRLLDQRADPRERPSLHWHDHGRWHPVLRHAPPIEGVVDLVAQELQGWRDEPALGLRFEGQGAAEDDLKPEPGDYRCFAEHAAALAATGHARTAALAVAFASELVQDNNGKTKPTALHFTAGQQQFLNMVRQLLHGVCADDLREALIGPWRGNSRLPSMSWDASAARIYALRASDPSKEKRGSVPGADVLAFMSLPTFPVVANPGMELVTACVTGGWKTSRFCWPLWTAPARHPTVHSLLLTGDLASTTAAQRAARGIAVVFQSNILRSDQGGYGSFTPARVA